MIINLLVFLLITYSLSQSLYISEIMIDNRLLLDERLNRPSWIEIHNPTTLSYNLIDWKLICYDTSSNNSVAWNFPNYIISPSSYILLFASQRVKLPQSDVPPFHTNFLLPMRGKLEFVQTGVVINTLEYQSTTQLPQISYGLSLPTSTVYQYFLNPTPGTANSVDSSVMNGIVNNPIFSDGRDYYTSPVTLEITNTDTTAITRYTTDFTFPSDTIGAIIDSTLNFTIRTTTTVRAVSCKTGYICSPVQTHTFIFVADLVNPLTTVASNPIYSVDDPTGSLLSISMSKTNLFDLTTYTAAEVQTALKSLTTVMITAADEDIFGTNGFYNSDIERRAILEFIYPSQNYDNLVCECGIGSRHAKRSLELIFGSTYLNATLNSNVFISNISSTLQDLQLVNDVSYKLLASDFRNYASITNPALTVLSMNRFMSSLQSTTGYRISNRGEFHHLFLNHVYIGIYSLIQSIDKTFVQDFIGSIEEGPTAWSVTPIWNSNKLDTPPDPINAILSPFLNPELDLSNFGYYQSLNSVFNVTNFCDFMILQFVSGFSNVQWPLSYAISRTDNTVTMFFLTEDAELAFSDKLPSSILTLNSADGYTAPSVPSFYSTYSDTIPWISKLLLLLKKNQLFSIKLADRIQDMIVDSNGPLATTVMNEKWTKINSLLSASMLAELSRWGNLLSPVTSATYSTATWNSAVQTTTTKIGSLNGLLLSSFKTLNWLSALPVPLISSSKDLLDFNSLISINSGIFDSPTTLSTVQSNTYVIYFSMSSTELFTNNGTLRASTYIYNSLLGVKLTQADISNGGITIKSRSWQYGPGLGDWSAAALSNFVMSTNLINPTTSFIYFSTGRSTLTSDLSASNSQIFSSLLTFNIFPSTLSQMNVILNYINFDGAISKELLYFDTLDSKFPVIITSTPQTSSAIFILPAGLQTITFLVYSVTPISSPQIIFIQADNSKFVIDSRSVFYLNTTVSNNAVAASSTARQIGISLSSTGGGGITNKPLFNSTIPPALLPDAPTAKSGQIMITPTYIIMIVTIFVAFMLYI